MECDAELCKFSLKKYMYGVLALQPLQHGPVEAEPFVSKAHEFYFALDTATVL